MAGKLLSGVESTSNDLVCELTYQNGLAPGTIEQAEWSVFTERDVTLVIAQGTMQIIG